MIGKLLCKLGFHDFKSTKHPYTMFAGNIVELPRRVLPLLSLTLSLITSFLRFKALGSLILSAKEL